MGLSASMYSGTSGLKVHGEAMTVIGNNISNVSTLGYKGSSMYFEDALSQEITTASGVGQVGRGVSVGSVMADFAQGSLETTTSATDLAIGGNGFFVVSPAGEEVSYYTRAGNFTFDEDGYLVDPHGYRLQGWAVQTAQTSVAATGDASSSASTGVKTTGVPQDIKLENFQSPPQFTSHVDMAGELRRRLKILQLDVLRHSCRLHSRRSGRGGVARRRDTCLSRLHSPTLQAVTVRIDQVPVLVESEIPCPGIVAHLFPGGGDHEKAVAADGQVRRGSRRFKGSLGEIGHDRTYGNASTDLSDTRCRCDFLAQGILEIHARTLVSEGRNVGDVVADHGHGLAMNLESARSRIH